MPDNNGKEVIELGNHHFISQNNKLVHEKVISRSCNHCAQHDGENRH